MKHPVLLALSLLILSIPPCAWSQEVFNTNMPSSAWSNDAARNQAFSGVPNFINAGQFPATDPNLVADQDALQNNQTRVNETFIMKDGEEGYEIHRDNAHFFYTQDGTLYKIAYKNGYGYPFRQVDYDYPSGQIHSVTLFVSPSESFKFDSDQQLVRHMMGDQCFLGDGSLCGYR